MTILTGKRVDRPRFVKNTKDGWTIMAIVLYYQRGFNMGVAQDGDPMGITMLLNPSKGMFVARVCNLDNSRARDNAVSLGEMVERTYRKKVDYKALHELAKPAFDRFFGMYGQAGWY